MTVAARYPLSLAIVLGAVIATTGAFLFARPQYRPPHQSYVPPAPGVAGPVRGWTWERPIPGFRFGHQEERWNLSQLRWADLAPVRYGARGAGADPQSLRVLDAARLAPGVRPYALVAARGCVGVQLEGSARFFCGAELRSSVGVMLASARANYGRGWSIYIDGVVPAEVTRVTVTTAGSTSTDARSGVPVVKPAGPQDVWRRGWKTWGTFASYVTQPVPWNARVDFYGEHGLLATRELRFSHPGERVYAVSSAQRRS
jgi:hypothetical protein